MGILSWWRGESKKRQPEAPAKAQAEVEGMNGAVEVLRPAKAGSVTVFEFGRAAADKVTMAGFCPVSDDLEPCRWQIFPAASADAPQFRVAF